MRALIPSLFAATLILAPSSASAQEILIGAAGPMSGQFSSFGEQVAEGAKKAVEDINEAGGVNGRMLKLMIEDDQCDGEKAVSVANRFAATDVAFVAGHFCSGASFPASAVYAEEKIVQISPAATNPKLTDERAGPGVYRVTPRDDMQGTFAGRYMAENHAEGKIAIFHDKSAYGEGLATNAKTALNAAGVTEAIFDTYTSGETDYTSLVTRLKTQDIGVLFIGGYHAEAALIVRQMREQDVQAQLIGGDTLLTEEFWAITGAAGQGTMVSFAADVTKFGSAKDLVKAFRKRKFVPEGYTLHTYAAVKIWAEAANAAGSTDFGAVTKALDSTAFETVLGQITFDRKGDITEPFYDWYVWDKGAYKAM